jgi:hypothetical protein
LYNNNGGVYSATSIPPIYTSPIPTIMDPARAANGMSSIRFDPANFNNTYQSAGPVSDYSANALLIGSGLNTVSVNGSPSYPPEWWAGPGSWAMFRRRLETIPDGTSNTIMLGTKGLATIAYDQRGEEQLTASNGAILYVWDRPMTDCGPDDYSNFRSYGPDTTWWMAGNSTDPSEPLSGLPGSQFQFSPGFSGWWYKTFEVVRDAPDFDFQNRWGGPYAGGGLFALADGSVRTLRHGTGYKIIIPLVTPRGGEVVNLDGN